MKTFQSFLAEAKKDLFKSAQKKTLKDKEYLNSGYNSERMYHKASDEQYRLIKKKHGKEVAENANYGWGQGDGFIHTKCYGVNSTLYTTWDKKGKITHEWQPYRGWTE